jgi:hypothetical protein
MEDDKFTVYGELNDSDVDTVRIISAPHDEYGVEPSTLHAVAHGGTNYFGYDGADSCGKLEFGTHVHDTDIVDRSYYDLAKMPLAMIIRRAMRPSHATGLRTIIIASCEQARRGQVYGLSTIEVMAQAFDAEDNVAVCGSDADIATLRVDGEVRLWDVMNDLPGDVYTYRRTAPDVVEVQMGKHLPGLPKTS